jgi:hypothetical protein
MDRVCDIRNILMSGVNAEATVWNVGYLNRYLISQMRLISCGSLLPRHIGVYEAQQLLFLWLVFLEILGQGGGVTRHYDFERI